MRTLLCVLLLAVAASLAAAPSLPSRVEIKYRVSLGSMKIGEGRDVFEHDGKTYSVVSESKTAGVAAVIYNLNIRRDSNSTPWLVDAIWSTAKKLNRPEFVDISTPIEDDHLEFLGAGIDSVDIIDLNYPEWHKATDDLAHVSADSLQAVGDVDDRAIPCLELSDGIEDLVDFPLGQGGGRLVEDKDGGVAHQSARDLQQLPFRQGKVAHPDFEADRFQPDGIKRLPCRGSALGRAPREWCTCVAEPEIVMH